MAPGHCPTVPTAYPASGRAYPLVPCVPSELTYATERIQPASKVENQQISKKNTTQLNRDNLNLYTTDRPQGRGGGLALTVSLHNKGTKPSFEFAHWYVKSRNTTLNVHGIYHPPYSLTNKITNQMFIDDFTDYVSTSLPDHQNNIYIGDFNLHVSDQLDTDSAIFNDSIEAMGLYQHVHFQMHKSGNVLDLLLSDITQSMGVLAITPGPYLSDH